MLRYSKATQEACFDDYLPYTTGSPCNQLHRSSDTDDSRRKENFCSQGLSKLQIVRKRPITLQSAGTQNYGIAPDVSGAVNSAMAGYSGVFACSTKLKNCIDLGVVNGRAHSPDR